MEKKIKYHTSATGWRLLSAWGYIMVLLATVPLAANASSFERGGRETMQETRIELPALFRNPATDAFVAEEELKNGHPKLSFALNQVLSALRAEGAPRMRSVVNRYQMRLEDGRLRVVIEVHADPQTPVDKDRLASLKHRIEAAGGRFELVYRNLVQALMPVESLESLASAESVRRIREPLLQIPYESATPSGGGSGTSTRDVGSEAGVFQPARPGGGGGVPVPTPDEETIGEGVALIGADLWHDLGWTGAGVKVAIVDQGFLNHTALLGIDLPPSVITRFYGTSIDIDSTVHGTACAEIIHDIAPDAQLYFTQPRTEVELGDAIDWLISQGVAVASYSITWSITAGPLDGTGIINEIINTAIDGGIAWIASAGNQGISHWGGVFSDADANGFLNFTAADELNEFLTNANAVIIGMIWDDVWGAATSDYDLYVFRTDTPQVPVAVSAEPQNGTGDPAELVAFYPVPGVSYGFAAKKINGGDKQIHISALSGNPIQYPVPATSIGIPADNPRVSAAGAVPWNSPTEIESFSSQGPTTDGRIKPNLVAPDRVSVSALTYGSFETTGGFGGTSASAPHAAGAAALIKQLFPDYTAAQIRNHLEVNALDLGQPGADNVFGRGRLALPLPDASCATFDLETQTLRVLCFELEGVSYRLDLQLVDPGSAAFELVGFGPSSASGSQCAQLDIPSAVLRVVCLQIGGGQFWLDFELIKTDPITFQLVDFGLSN